MMLLRIITSDSLFIVVSGGGKLSRGEKQDFPDELVG
jgi:hypothetical protein